ncbi:helix-turn-helix domain-containing protein [Jeotgalibacillus sp. R-1-5s-1]|uniref:helix-turn-helix domain-containing protein n=1 Tax=Jeotgalibacillus sp. R-1-5s-1 TaxID=2555897 RepID=UPI00106B810D|nr:helix-turn-helix transcriptional regulator [Jeotgalibacillus sp. R-1-5s-1]TFD97027.1 XRE family transcriptional regulator [Jeotgalibacillus sp. R-1-5s-1]
MAIYQQLKYYREEVLNMTQSQAARLLNIDQSTLSNYERGSRQIPLELLRLFKEKYYIDDDMFLAMLFQDPSSSGLIKEGKKELQEKVLKAEDQQLVNLIREHPSLMEELRELASLPKNHQKNRADVLVRVLQILKKSPL